MSYAILEHSSLQITFFQRLVSQSVSNWKNNDFESQKHVYLYFLTIFYMYIQD